MDDTLISPDLSALLGAELGKLRSLLSDADRKVAAAVSERDGIAEKVRAVEVLLGRPSITLPDEEEEVEGALTMGEVVIRILSDGVPRTASEIRAEMISGGFDAEKLSPTKSYFYTKLSRMVARGRLNKQGDRYAAR